MDTTDTRALALWFAESLSERRAEQLRILHVENLVSYADYLVVATGRNERHVRALAEHLQRDARTQLRVRPISSEGVERGQWALLDYGDIVVHVFREQERDYYDLEGLWQDAEEVPFEASEPPAESYFGG